MRHSTTARSGTRRLSTDTRRTLRRGNIEHEGPGTLLGPSLISAACMRVGSVRSGWDGTGRPGFRAAARGGRWVEDLSGWGDAPAPARVEKWTQVALPTRSAPGLDPQRRWGCGQTLGSGTSRRCTGAIAAPASPGLAGRIRRERVRPTVEFGQTPVHRGRPSESGVGRRVASVRARFVTVVEAASSLTGR